MLRAGVACIHGVSTLIECFEQFVFAELESRVQGFEEFDVVVFAEETDIVQAVADLSVPRKSTHDHPDFSHLQDAIDTCESFGCREVNAIDLGKIEDKESNGMRVECILFQ